MRHINPITALLAMSMAAAADATAPSGHGLPSLSFPRHTPSKRYPEQSARQALRGFRRAQGGPGITEGADPQPRVGSLA
jgi:hypothetical protein